MMKEEGRTAASHRTAVADVAAGGTSVVSTTSARSTKAVLIGVSDYSAFDPAKNLRGVPGDLARWKKICGRIGIEAVETATSPEDTKKAPIEVKFQELATWLTRNPGGKGVLVFAGHGDVSEGNNPADLYLCPSDVKREGDAIVNRLSLKKLLAKFDLTNSTLVLILDCCFGARIAGDDPDEDEPVSTPRFASRSLRDIPTRPAVAFRAMLNSLEPRLSDHLTVLSAGHAQAYEVELTDGWVGAFSWAATDVLWRWSVAEAGGDKHFMVDPMTFAETARNVLEALHIPQRPAAHPQRQIAVFQALTDAPRSTCPNPNMPLGRIELSGGTTGYRIYHVLTKTNPPTNLGRILATSPDPGASGLAANTEYWEVNLDAMGTNNVRIRFHADAQTMAPTRLPAQDAPHKWKITITSDKVTSVLNDDYTSPAATTTPPHLNRP